MTEPEMFRRHAHGLITKVDRAQPAIELVVTREEVDADSEVIVARGVDLSRYVRNPVVLLMHDPTRRIGRMESLTLQTVAGKEALVGRARLRDGDVAGEVADGVLGGVSIGFRSVERGAPILPGQHGPTHRRTELLEVSLVSIPSCASCTVIAKAMTGTRTAGAACRLDVAAFDRLVHQRVTLAVDAAVARGVRRALLHAQGRVD
jgi:hypothetical protein